MTLSSSVRFLVLSASSALVLAGCGGGGTTAGGADADASVGDLVFPDVQIDLGGEVAAEIPADPGTIDPGTIDPGPVDPGTIEAVETDGIMPVDTWIDPVCPLDNTVIVSEIMIDPAMSGEPEGEYFELFNRNDTDVVINGWEIAVGSKKAIVQADAPVVIPSKGYLLLGRSADLGENGGIAPAYVYDKVQFTNTGSFTLTVSCVGTVVDKVVYVSATWPRKSGRSVQLDPSAFDATLNDVPAGWCLGFDTYGAGDLGSPGLENRPCGALSCGDKVVQTWEACDDGNVKKDDGCDPGCVKSLDSDGDTVPDAKDNCPDKPNADQLDSDNDDVGDACDLPSCGNNTPEVGEACDDGNKVKGDGCENDCTVSVDEDGDGVYESIDNCPGLSNPPPAAGQPQADLDGDGVGDACDYAECGNEFLEGTEQCDDGNSDSGDGCSMMCGNESFAVGSVIVTEIMYAPKAVDATTGEYFEVYNTTDEMLDLGGWVLTDEVGNTTTLVTPEGFLLIGPKEFLVFGKVADPEVNGGLILDYAYGSAFTLAAKADKVVLKWNGTVIDKVVYGTALGFPEASGASLGLVADKLDAVSNDDPGNWCVSAGTKLPDGDFGTPGAVTDVCEGAPVPEATTADPS